MSQDPKGPAKAAAVLLGMAVAFVLLVALLLLAQGQMDFS